MLEKPPSAELRPDQTDRTRCPPYAVLDPILEGYVEDDRSVAELEAAGFDRDTVAARRRAGRPHRVQAPPGAARRAGVAEGVRQGPAPADHQPLAWLSGGLGVTACDPSGVARALPELALARRRFLYGSTFMLVQDALDARHADRLQRAAVRRRRAPCSLPFALRATGAVRRRRPTDPRRFVLGGVVARRHRAFVAYLDPERRAAAHVHVELGFITGLFVVFTPLVERGRLPPAAPPADRRWRSCSLVGLFLLTGASSRSSFGDAVTLITAFSSGSGSCGPGVVANRFDIFGADLRSSSLIAGRAGGPVRRVRRVRDT